MQLGQTRRSDSPYRDVTRLQSPPSLIMTIVTKYWFPIGLILVCAVTLTGFGDPVAMAGRWVRAHHGADITMVVVFFFSGAMLQTDQIRRGLRDLRGTTAALLLIFVMAPLVALPIIQLPFSPGVRIGLLLVAVMPTTLSSGVVMTGAAGGNVAQALLITVFANVLAVFTIPVAPVPDGAATDAGRGGSISISG